MGTASHPTGLTPAVASCGILWHLDDLMVSCAESTAACHSGSCMLDGEKVAGHADTRDPANTTIATAK
jgi:hypothetical protein